MMLERPEKRRPPMTDRRVIDTDEDPVCGMRPDPDAARDRGLAWVHEGREYVFCGKGCLLEFKDDPERFLAADYTPVM
jgi:YHS domain-containing protein